jgi:hypothetical protein
MLQRNGEMGRSITTFTRYTRGGYLLTNPPDRLLASYEYIQHTAMPYREESHSPPRRHLERSLSPERDQIQNASPSAGPSKRGRVGPNDIQRRHVRLFTVEQEK